MNKIVYSDLFGGTWVSENYCLLEDFPGDDQLMQGQYIRHPSDIPIKFSVGEVKPDNDLALKEVCYGGLSFVSNRPLDKGATIRIEIPIASTYFEAEGIVMWCRVEGVGFAVGVCFDDEKTKYSIRMVEQVCHIEHYRQGVFSEQGRLLTTEEAAQEWVEQYAGHFPSLTFCYAVKP